MAAAYEALFEELLRPGGGRALPTARGGFRARGGHRSAPAVRWGGRRRSGAAARVSAQAAAAHGVLPGGRGGRCDRPGRAHGTDRPRPRADRHPAPPRRDRPGAARPPAARARPGRRCCAAAS
ncbi:hypothetical protein NKH77_31080 [Streptomyces sp. M19]